MASISFGECRKQLETMRKSAAPNCYEVLKYGKPLIKTYSSSLGEEEWAVYEQVLIAALDSYPSNTDLVEDCSRRLQKKFGKKSSRIRMLEGMIEEAKGRFDEANKIYDTILKDDPSYASAAKRKINIELSCGRVNEGIQLLIKYLDIYMNDIEAWKELCEVYLNNRMFSAAAHCLEELILLSPHNHLFYLKYAMVLYTMGGADNLLLARQHFSMVLNLNPNNSRALIGLKLACNALAGIKSLKSDDVNYKLNEFATKQLVEKYEPKPTTTTLSPPAKEATLSAIASLNVRQKNKLEKLLL